MPQPATLKIPEGISLTDGLSEDEAVAIALWNNQALQSDLAQLGLAQADLIDAGLLRNPTLQVLLPLGFKQFEMLANLPSEVLWQRKRRVAAAKLEYDRVAKGLEQSGLNLVRDVRVAYANLASAQGRKLLADEAVRLRGEIARLTRARLSLGDISELEANASQVDRVLAEEQAARLTHDVEFTRARLMALMGEVTETRVVQIKPFETNSIAAIPASLHSTNNSLATVPIEEMMKDAFDHRPDLRAAELAIEAAAGRAKWERSRLFTFASLLSIKQGEGLNFSPRPGFMAELPVFHRNKGGIAKADAEVERAGKQYLAVRQQIAIDVREAVTQWRQAGNALEIYRTRLLPQAEIGVKLAEQRYRNGEESYLFVMETTRQLIDARMREIELIADVYRAAAQVERSIGRKREK